jgi:hypothetical protein
VLLSDGVALLSDELTLLSDGLVLLSDEWRYSRMGWCYSRMGCRYSRMGCRYSRMGTHYSRMAGDTLGWVVLLSDEMASLSEGLALLAGLRLLIPQGSVLIYKTAKSNIFQKKCYFNTNKMTITNWRIHHGTYL